MGLLAVGLTIACFSEPMSDATCRDGEVGCSCGAAGCEAGLVCTAGIDVCIPEECVPGSELCTCNDGECLAGLTCEVGLCREPQGSGSMSADDVATIDDTSLTDDPATTTTDDPSMPTSAETSPTSVSITDDSSMTTESGTGPDGAACHACIIDSNGAGGDCEMQLFGCAANSDCADLASCVGTCLDADDPLCILDCCELHPSGVAEYSGLAVCQGESCGMECVEFTLMCPGGG